jgi:hypothetical protein
MKTLIIGTTLAALIASPAFAQSYNPGDGTGNVMNQTEAEQTNGALGFGADQSATQASPFGAAYAYAPGPRQNRQMMGPYEQGQR